MIQKRAEFEGRTYVVGRTYAFEDLPDEVKEDLWRQEEGLELAYGKGRRSLRYRFLIVDPDRLVRCMERSFGKELFQERIQEEDVIDLVSQIKAQGLLNPPVEGEGYHRALALASLRWPMPYFEVAQTPRHPLPAICRSDEAGLP